MFKAIVWLLLTLVSSCGLAAYFLQQQYEEKSADYRILYREITVKLSQHDAIIALLPVNPHSWEAQKLFPHIIRWSAPADVERQQPIVAEPNGRYWLNMANQSLLIDLNRLMNDVIGNATFRHLAIRWNNALLFEQGDAAPSYYWRWDKEIASQSQPFELAVGDNPNWAALPWPIILFPALFWGALLWLFNQYQVNKRRRDIADLRAHYTELTRLNTLGELAAGIVHELNQPLTAILSYNQTALRLIQQQQPEQLPQILEAAVVQIKRTDGLLQQFRQKLTSEQADYLPVVLSDLWPRVITLLDNEIRSKKINVTSHIADALPTLYAPPLWVEQILHNIASNAIQAQDNNAAGTAWLTLSAQHQNGGISVTLTDGGPGLSPLALQQVFIPFFTTRPHGIGLGMALTDTLIQRLNGTITVSNIEGGGAMFTLWLPVHTQEGS